DYNQNRIRAIAPGGAITTLAGNGGTAFHDGTGGPTGTATFWGPFGVSLDGNGDLIVVHLFNLRIRRVSTADGTTTTIAGNGMHDVSSNPAGAAADAAGNIYVGDMLNHRVREILPDGQVVTFAGTGTAGFKDGPADVAQFTGPTGIAVDASGNIYV